MTQPESVSGLAPYLRLIRAALASGEADRALAWLDRRFDPQGMPHTGTTPAVWALLAGVDQVAASMDRVLPPALLQRFATIFQTCLILDGPEGLQGPDADDRLALLQRWAIRRADASVLPIPPGRSGLPPAALARLFRGLPASRWHESRVVGVARTGWRAPVALRLTPGDRGGPALGLEKEGIAWLGAPDQQVSGASSGGRWQAISASPAAEVLEWRVPARGGAIRHLAILFRDRPHLLLATLAPASLAGEGVALRLAPQASARSLTRVRGLRVDRAGAPPLRIFPLGLPSLPHESAHGRLETVEGRVELVQAANGRDTWMPLLLSWDDDSQGKRPQWRVLTVTEERKICPPRVATAVRIGWPGEDSLVLYQSHRSAAPRAFLGHQTGARLLVGSFNSEGTLTPLVELPGSA